METAEAVTVVKGPSVTCGRVRIVPILRRSCQTLLVGAYTMTVGSVTPIGVQIVTDAGTYALDLAGNRSEELDRL